MGFAIEGVTVVDGTGADPYVGTVRVEGDRIVEVKRAGSAGSAGSTSGLVLSPGFVDVHTHDDAAVLVEPVHSVKTLQGVTSVVVGNCGFSPAPGPEGGAGGVLGEVGFPRMGDYLDAVDDARPAVNVAALVGHNSIRAGILGPRNRAEATDAELTAMLDVLAGALDDGAVGFSSGLVYEPGRYSPASELHAFAELAAARGAIYTTHMRNEGDHLLEAIDECVEVAESTGIALQISHLKASGRHNHGKVVDGLARIDAARARGVDVMADQYPYTRGSTMLEQVVSAGALDGPSAFGHVPTKAILVAAAPRTPTWEGRTLDEIASAEGVEPREMADRIVEAEGQGCFVVLDLMHEDDVCAVMRHPMVMIGTDGIPAGAKPHPRVGHTYPRILGRYVRDQGLLGLAEAVRKMTSLPAQRFGFVERGVIAEGAFADLVLFDPDTIVDTGTWTEPSVPPDGIVGVWVNGERVVDGQAATGVRPGRTMRAM